MFTLHRNSDHVALSTDEAIFEWIGKSQLSLVKFVNRFKILVESLIRLGFWFFSALLFFSLSHHRAMADTASSQELLNVLGFFLIFLVDKLNYLLILKTELIIAADR